MAVYGYHRASIKEQHLDRGIQEISQYCKQNQIPLVGRCFLNCGESSPLF